MSTSKEVSTTLHTIQQQMSCNFLIVGAGVSGLYCAYKLAKERPDAKIVVLEKLSRIGGRIQTGQYRSHVLEYGPMRFEPKLQKRFGSLMQELGIQVKEFPPYTCPHTKPDLNTLTFEEVAAINKYATLPPAFALLKHGLSKILEDQWDVDGDDINDPNRDARKTWLKKEGMFQGRYLYQHGLWDTLAHVLSKNALDFLLQKGTFYHMLELNPNAADQICFMLDILATANDHLVTVDGGSEKIIDKLKEVLEKNKNVMIKKSISVKRFTDHPIRMENFKVGHDWKTPITVEAIYTDLITDEVLPETYVADHVIFTCQKKAYRYIEGFNHSIRRALDNVMVVKLFKVFVIFENPPYTKETIPLPNTNADKIPCRELHYDYDEKHNTGMIMIYGDMPTINYWRGFHSRESVFPIGDKNDHLKNHLAHYLRKLFAEDHPTTKSTSKTLPQKIIYYSIMDWSHAPYHAGVHLWKPGVVSEHIIQFLSSFGEKRTLHICGETYSDYQGFIEGGLRTVDNVVHDILRS